MGCTRLKSDFGLNTVTEVYFWKSEWECFDPCDKRIRISSLFLAYRFIYAIYFVLTLFFNLIWISPERLGYWPIYLTNWSYSAQTAYSLVALWVVVGAKWESLQDPVWGLGQDEFIGCTRTNQTTMMTKMVWILFNITTMVPFGVTIIYWVAVYDPASSDTLIQIVSNYALHVANAVLSIVDTFVVAIPVRLSHFVFGLTFLLSYLLFTIFYEVFGGTYENGTEYIYKVLNWKQDPAGAAVTASISMLLFIVCHTTFAWGLSRVRAYFAYKLASGYSPL